MPISVQEAAQRLTESASLASRYQRGTQGKGGAWATGAGSAGPNYAAGVQAGITKRRYESGVSGAGASAYDRGVQTKGVNNWGQGMQLGGEKYQRKVQKFASLWGASLAAPRGPRGSAANLTRMTENVKRFSDAAAK